MLRINKKFTIVNYTSKNNPSRIKYIVVHYVGAVSTAANNATYFSNVYRGASAHYFVDKNEIWQIVQDEDIAWHCGASSYKHPFCRNSNSIGIELCCKRDTNGKLYIENGAVSSALVLIRYLIKKYKIPKDNVIRHFDVTGKACPEPFLNEQKWKKFKDRI